MFTAISTALTTALTLPPPAPPSTPIRAEVHHGPDSTQIVTFDADDQVTAEIVVWIVDQGNIRIDAIFPDDIHTMAVVNGRGEVIDIDNEDHDLVAPRIAAVLDLLADTEPQAGWLPCALHGTMAVVELAHANPWGIASAVLAACSCLPLLVEEFEDLECPGY